MKKSTKKPLNRKELFFILIFSLVQSVAAEENDFKWQTASPESQGMSSNRLNEAMESLAEKGTKKLLVIKNDRIVCEWYAPGDGPENYIIQRLLPMQ